MAERELSSIPTDDCVFRSATCVEEELRNVQLIKCEWIMCQSTLGIMLQCRVYIIWWDRP